MIQRGVSRDVLLFEAMSSEVSHGYPGKVANLKEGVYRLKGGDSTRQLLTVKTETRSHQLYEICMLEEREVCGRHGLVKKPKQSSQKLLVLDVRNTECARMSS